MSKVYFYLFLLVTPFFWWNLLFDYKNTIQSILLIPSYTKANFQNIASAPFAKASNDYRYNTILNNQPLTSKILFSRPSIYFKTLLDPLISLSPNFLFFIPGINRSTPPDLPAISIFALPILLVLFIQNKLVYKKMFFTWLFGYVLSVLTGITNPLYFFFFYYFLIKNIFLRSNKYLKYLYLIHSLYLLTSYQIR